MDMQPNSLKSNTLRIVHIILMSVAAIIAEVFIVLCLTYFIQKWHEALWWTAIISMSVLNLALLIIDIVFYLRQKETIDKLCITIYVMVIFFAAVFYALLATGFMDIVRDEDSLEEYLARSGGWMGVVFTVLQFLQVVILPIPSTVTVVAGTALFGPLKGSLLSLLGIFIGSTVAFLVGRYAGIRVVSWLVGRETLEKWLKKVKGKDKLLLSAMFLLPVFPDDILCFVAGMSSMSLPYFLGVIAVSRVLAIFTTSYSITLIPLNTWWGLLIWAILIVLVIVLFIFLYKKSDAILGWFEKKFHREKRVDEKIPKDEFSIEVIDPDGAIVKKGVKKEGDDSERNDN